MIGDRSHFWDHFPFEVLIAAVSIFWISIQSEIIDSACSTVINPLSRSNRSQ